MDDLDQSEEFHLAAWQRVHAPGPRVAAEHLRRLQSAVLADRLRRRRRVLITAAAAVATAAVLLLAVWLGGSSLDQEHRASGEAAASFTRLGREPSRVIPGDRRSAESDIGSHEPAMAVIPPTSEPPSSRERPVSTSQPRPVERHVSRTSSEEHGAPVSSSSDTLSEEIHLLGSASASLRAGDPGRALALLRDHERRFQNSSLLEERSAWIAVALCRLHRRPEGIRVASEFVARYPNSLHLPRIQSACATMTSEPPSPQPGVKPR